MLGSVPPVFWTVSSTHHEGKTEAGVAGPLSPPSTSLPPAAAAAAAVLPLPLWQARAFHMPDRDPPSSTCNTPSTAGHSLTAQHDRCGRWWCPV